VAQVVILGEYCKSCGLCLSVCPKQVLQISDKSNQKGYYPVEVVRAEQCIGCTLCGLMCPDLAIEIIRT
jgi:2-oxoglutarate ferredoxin oxidoreductase subunit delta